MKSIKPDQGQTGPARTASILARCPPGLAYALALVLPAAALLVSLRLASTIGGAPVLMVFLLPIVLCAYAGGWGPGLTATVSAAGLAVYFILPPTHSFQISQGTDGLRLALMVVMGLLASSLSGALHRSRRRAEASERLQAVTLASIGDAVITTDKQGRITFLNREAERLTGWTCLEAEGRPLASVFRIVCEETRQTVDDPVEKVLQGGSVVGLANHTVLIGKNGQDTPIEDSGAPIKQADGTVLGVVLVFRDCTEKKKIEAAMQERLVLQEKMSRIDATAPG